MTQARVSITPSDAWSDQRLTPLQCRLLGLIGSYLGKDHRAWPSQNTLANELGVSRKAVNQGIQALKKYGYIEVETRQRDDGGQSSNCYFVRMDPLLRQSSTPSEPEVTPLLPESVTPCNPIEVTPPVTSEGYTHKKDPIERPKEDTASFDDAWNLYRSCKLKARQTKKLAKAEWARAIKKADPETILAAIDQEVRDRHNPKDFIPNLPDMHRWLKNERWQDVEQQTPAQPSTPDAWESITASYREHGVWPQALGPAPHEAGCQLELQKLQAIAQRLQGHRWHPRIVQNIEINSDRRIAS